jgi:hypothetical protein
MITRSNEEIREVLSQVTNWSVNDRIALARKVAGFAPRLCLDKTVEHE